MHDHAIGGKQRERETPRMDALNVRQSGQGVRVECEERSRQQPRRVVAGPFTNEDVAGESRKRKAEQKNHVEHEDWRSTRPSHRHAEDRRHDQRLGEGERVLRGIENVGIEQPRRSVRQLVRDPGEDPFVQQRIAVVVPAQRRRIGDERPGVNDREQRADEGREHGSPAGSGQRHTR